MSEGKSHVEASFMQVDGRDTIKLKFLLTPGDYLVRAVESADIEKYPNEWKVYSALRPQGEMTGTRLSTIPGITPQIAAMISLKGVTSAEALAALDNYAAHNLDPARGVTWRDTALLLLAAAKAAPQIAPPAQAARPVEQRKAA
jgi:hypothetical protein